MLLSYPISPLSGQGRFAIRADEHADAAPASLDRRTYSWPGKRLTAGMELRGPGDDRHLRDLPPRTPEPWRGGCCGELLTYKTDAGESMGSTNSYAMPSTAFSRGLTAVANVYGLCQEVLFGSALMIASLVHAIDHVGCISLPGD